VGFGPPPSPTGAALTDIELGGGVPVHTGVLRRAMACDLARWSVRTVVVGPMDHEEEAMATMTWVVGRAPEWVDGVWVWWDVAPSCLSPGSAPSPPST
jgi:hypothetical protein